MIFTDVKRVHLELTDKCNAACPMCMRTNPAGLKSQSFIKNSELTLQNIKHIFPKKVLENIDHFSFCGVLGDPAIATECLEIAEYISPIQIDMDTNGSLRKTDWWYNLGKIFSQNKKSIINFHLDGLEDTHHLYRIKTNFNKIIKNAQAFMKGGGKANWEFIVFGHNEHQIDEAEKRSKELGFKSFILKRSKRNDRIRSYTDKKGKKHKIYPPTNNYLPNKKTEKEYLNSQNKKFIDCKVSKNNRVYVQYDGMLHPCCYIAADTWKTNLDINLIYNMYDTNMLNLLKNPSGSIINIAKNNKIFMEIKDEWKNFGPSTCDRVCGKKYNSQREIRK